MSDQKLFEAAFPYADDVLALPVEDIDQAANWYGEKFDMKEIQRRASPLPTVILERDGVEIGFTVNGGDSSNEGAAIRVTDIHRAKAELEEKQVNVSDLRVDEDDGKKRHVFFVIAPDGLCYYFHQPVEE